jgi:hypothetical protein
VYFPAFMALHGEKLDPELPHRAYIPRSTFCIEAAPDNVIFTDDLLYPDTTTCTETLSGEMVPRSTTLPGNKSLTTVSDTALISLKPIEFV